MAVAVLAASAPVYADEAEIAGLTQPDSFISVGIGGVTGPENERGVFGQYNGWLIPNAALLLDFDINRRDEASGTALYFRGSHLGLTDREVFMSYEKQGDWKFGGELSELVHSELRTINSGLLGMTTPNPVVARLPAPGTGTDSVLSIKRVGLGLNAEKWLTRNLRFEANFRTEDRTGARTSGTGYDCKGQGNAEDSYVCTGKPGNTTVKWALLMLPEPVNTTSRQIEARLDYHHQGLNVNFGYYGSFFINEYLSRQATVPNILNSPTGGPATLFPAAPVPGGTSLQNVLQLPFALAPNNQANQFYLSGNYQFTPTTIGTFKYAYTRATQDQDFAASGLANAPAGSSSLGGLVNNTLLQLGLTARPMPRLNLLANVRYDNKDDKTPRALYNLNDTDRWYNFLVPSTKVVGKLEASYLFQGNTRGTVDLDYASNERSVPTSILVDRIAGLDVLRAKNEEKGYKLELRRAMSDTLTGAISYAGGRRTGSDWTSLSTSATMAAAGLGYGQTGSAAQFLAVSPATAFPMNMADVDLGKLKLSASWTPTEALEVQLNMDSGKSTNVTGSNAIAGAKAWQEAATSYYALDASYAITSRWKINGYISQGSARTRVNQGYLADLTMRGNGIGFGVKGQPTGQLQVGALVGYLEDTSKYGLVAAPTFTGTMPNITQVPPGASDVAQAAIGLPDVSYQSLNVSLYGTYDLSRQSAVRVNVVYQHTRFSEWSWVNNGTSFVYSDDTTLSMNPNQSVTLVGISYIYRF
jgi:MtrB/PioB family decaheme-associated outer membrane protein